MGKYEKLFELIIQQGQTTNIPFSDLQYLITRLGFTEKSVRGDHFTYKMSGVPDKINLQPNGKDAKPYQVRQVRNIVIQYKLGGTDDEI